MQCLEVRIILFNGVLPFFIGGPQPLASRQTDQPLAPLGEDGAPHRPPLERAGRRLGAGFSLRRPLQLAVEVFAAPAQSQEHGEHTAIGRRVVMAFELRHIEVRLGKRRHRVTGSESEPRQGGRLALSAERRAVIGPADLVQRDSPAPDAQRQGRLTAESAESAQDLLPAGSRLQNGFLTRPSLPISMISAQSNNQFSQKISQKIKCIE